MAASLIDGDILVYRCGFACQKNNWYADYGTERLGPFATKTEMKEYLAVTGAQSGYKEVNELQVEPIENCLHSVKHLLEFLRKGSGCAQSRIFLTGSKNFRKRVAKTKPYKGNRVAPKPVYYDEIRRYLIEVHGAEVQDYIEADDAIAVNLGTGNVAVSIDKDLRQVPGWHWDWTKEPEPVLVFKDEADFRFWAQMLTGDITDNIPGLPKYGDVKAEQVLRHCDDDDAMRDAVYREYERVHGIAAPEIFEEMYQLLRLLRTQADIDEIIQREIENEGNQSVPPEAS